MAKNNYWKKRLEEVAKIQADKADVIETEISTQYERSVKSISEQIEVFYARYAKTNDISMAEARRLLDKSELQGFKMTLNEFRDKALDNADGKWKSLLDSEYIKSRVSRLESLKCHIRGEVELLKQKQERSFEALLKDTYSDTFYRHIFECTREIGFEIDFSGLNTSAIEKAVYTKWLDGSNFSDRIWRDKEKLLRELNTNLVQSIIRGDSPDKTIAALSKRMNVSRNYAAALLQSESAHIMNEAAFDTYRALNIGEYEVIETLDSHTCGPCGDMDGRHFPVSEKELGVNCPPFHTGCRGFTVPHFDDEFTVSEKRAARDKDGKIYYTDVDITYKKWRKNVDKSAENDIIKSIDIDDFKLMSEAKNIDDKVVDVISSVIEKYEKSGEIYINDFYFGSLGNGEKGTALLQIQPTFNKTIQLNINTDVFGGRSLEEINTMLSKTEINLAKNLEEAVIHECGHAKSIKGLTINEIEALYKELADIHIEGVSKTAYDDGAEALAEIEVLIARGRNIPKNIMEFYNKYMKRK